MLDVALSPDAITQTRPADQHLRTLSPSTTSLLRIQQKPTLAQHAVVVGAAAPLVATQAHLAHGLAIARPHLFTRTPRLGLGDPTSSLQFAEGDGVGDCREGDGGGAGEERERDGEHTQVHGRASELP